MISARKKVLIAIGDVASGHRVPAIAIRDAIENLYPGRVTIEIVDFFQSRDPSPLSGGSAKTVRLMATNRFLSSINSAFWTLSNSRLFHPCEKSFIRKRCGNCYYDILRQKAPDLLITLHPYLSELLGKWRSALSFQHAAVVLELGTPMRASASNTFDLVVSPTELTTRRLRDMGVDVSRIITNLFPFQADLLLGRPRIEMVNELRLDAGKPIQLLTGGGISIAAMDDLLRQLVREERQIVILTGKDRAFSNSLRNIYSGYDSLRVIDFTDRVQDYYSVADLVIAKPGASTVMEMELLEKRCLLTFPAGPQEKGNLQYALQNPNFLHIGSSTSGVDALIEEVLSTSSVTTSRRKLGETKELAAHCLSLIL